MVAKIRREGFALPQIYVARVREWHIAQQLLERGWSGIAQ